MYRTGPNRRRRVYIYTNQQRQVHVEFLQHIHLSRMPERIRFAAGSQSRVIKPTAAKSHVILSAHVTFFMIAPYKYSYLLTYLFTYGDSISRSRAFLKYLSLCVYVYFAVFLA